jgi:hydroxymethylpyrimidine pyrophosphatase-like HAD family hydrolase
VSVSAPTRTPTLPQQVRAGGRYRDWRPGPLAYVVCDVDGTLVGRSAEASEAVVAAVARTEAAGVRVGYATGRMRDAVATLHTQIGASGPHILHNGAEIRADGATVATWSLSSDEIDALLAIAAAHDDLYLEVYAESGFHVSTWDERARPHWGLLGAEPLGVLARAGDLGDASAPKATFATFTDDALAWLLGRLDDLPLEAGPAGSPVTPHLNYVNVARPGVTKGAALRRAAEHLGVELGQVAAIGDATNDLSMLEVAGTAIAMGQADPQIRSAAHLVVPDVDADGVVVALEAIVTWSRSE